MLSKDQQISAFEAQGHSGRGAVEKLPIPLQELKNLSKHLGGPRIFVKRDDLTGLGFGGNKVRKLDFIMPQLAHEGVDTIVTGAMLQSNWCTAVTAACNKYGMKSVLVKKAPKGFNPAVLEGNHLLHHLLGADIHLASPGDDVVLKQELVDRLKSEGRRPALIGIGGNTPAGVAGYSYAVKEMLAQCEEIGFAPDFLVHASGSGGTQAGTVIGSKLYTDGRMKVICSSTGSRPSSVGEPNVKQLIKTTATEYGLDIVLAEGDVKIHDQYATGYGFVTEKKLEAVTLAAKLEGLILDPTYSGSGMACVIDLCRSGFFRKDQCVVFLHTGGLAGLFPYEAPLHAYLESRELPWEVPPWYPTEAGQYLYTSPSA